MRRLPIILVLAGLSLLACGKKSKVPTEQVLFTQAQGFEKNQEYSKADDLYRTLIENYPNSPIRYKALFMSGYIQLEQLKDNQKAARTFETLLKEYPTCDLADDARVMRDIAQSGKDLMTVFQDSLKGK